MMRFVNDHDPLRLLAQIEHHLGRASASDTSRANQAAS
jgi:uncharacterized protein (DUF2249 family)